MSDANGMIRQARETRLETISVLEKLEGKAGEFELPKPPEALEHYREKLEQNSYKVLVVGETKKGKSTFVNALLGEDILPTNVRVSTSQVFNVRQMEDMAYRLRFEDGSVREITQEDLPRYGSQVMEDAGERPGLDQIIRWIEVDRPDIRFFPEGVSLLDTPGLGALYAAHARITQRFVPEADAVIFVLDSEKPIVQTEVDFIETVLSQTPDIFFIQTKIDMFDEAAWKNVQSRNREILEEKFGERLTDRRIWPISSDLLRKAATNEAVRDLFLEKSLYDELAAALQTFLFRVAGWKRSAEAILVAGRYHSVSRPTLSERLAGLVEESTQKRADIQRRAAERKQRFESEWGQRGKLRAELSEGIKKRIDVSRRRFDEALRFEGAVGKTLRKKIVAVASLNEAKELNDRMDDEVKAAAGTLWRQQCEEARTGCAELLTPLIEAADSVLGSRNTDAPELAIGNAETIELERSLWKKVKGARGDAAEASTIGAGAGAVALAIISSGPPAWVGALIGGAIAGLWGLVVGYKDVGAGQLIDAKAQLEKNLEDVIQQARHQFFGVPETSFRLSHVDEYFGELQRVMDEQVKAVVDQKLEEAQAEDRRLAEAGDLDEQQREERIEHTKRQLAEWDGIGKSIESTGAKLNALDQPPAVEAG